MLAGEEEEAGTRDEHALEIMLESLEKRMECIMRFTAQCIAPGSVFQTMEHLSSVL